MGLSRVAGVAIITLGLLVPSPAGANGLPVQRSAAGSSVFWPLDAPEATILSERLFITVIETDRRKAEVQVQAHYQIALLDGAQAQEVLVAFVMDGDRLDQVELDGYPVLIQVEDGISLTGMVFTRQTYDPLTGEAYVMDLYGSGDEPQLTRAPVFAIQLEPQRRHDLVVSYRASTGYDQHRYLNTIYHYTYFLTPASAWAGFGDLSLTVSVPRGFRAVLSLDQHMQEVSPGVFSGTLSGLPVDQELHISLMSNAGLWTGVVSRLQANYLWLLGTGIYVGSMLVRRASFLRSLAAIWLLAVSMWVLRQNLWPYPFEVLQIPTLIAIVLVVVVAEVRRWRSRSRLSEHRA